MKANYGFMYRCMVVGITIMTVGFGYLLVLFMKRQWIDKVTDQGAFSLNGTEYMWSQLTNSEELKTKASTVQVGGHVIGAVVLQFQTGRVILNGTLVSNAEELLLFIAENLGTHE